MEFLYKSCIDCEDHTLVYDGVDASMARTDNHNHNSDKSEITIESTEVESAKLTGCFLISCMLCILIMVILDKLPEHQDVTVAAKPVSNKKKLWREHYCCVPLCCNDE